VNGFELSYWAHGSGEFVSGLIDLQEAMINIATHESGRKSILYDDYRVSGCLTPKFSCECVLPPLRRSRIRKVLVSCNIR
jgi:hypothetical protein